MTTTTLAHKPFVDKTFQYAFYLMLNSVHVSIHPWAHTHTHTHLVDEAVELHEATVLPEVVFRFTHHGVAATV